jgi:hypothetical protein
MIMNLIGFSRFQTAGHAADRYSSSRRSMHDHFDSESTN